jgi:prepilin-type N-terminal cleavage/methylation domain-containing protein
MNTSNKTNGVSIYGFTLIELLVVIAIIGVVSSLVLVAVGGARTKAADAAIKSDLRQFRNLAEAHYEANSASYRNLQTCITSATPATEPACKGGIGADVAVLKSDIDKQVGVTDAVTAFSPVGVETTKGYCIRAKVKNSTSYTACIDSTGRLIESSGFTCDAYTFECH